jgi:hypothetical protein
MMGFGFDNWGCFMDRFICTLREVECYLNYTTCNIKRWCRPCGPFLGNNCCNKKDKKCN